MARQLRLDLAGATYHVTQHGIDDMAIFNDDDDRNCFLRFLGVELVRSRWTCLAYCLMKTHYHLLVRPRKATLSSGFHHLNGRYAQWFNTQHGRRGHVFESRFRDRLVESLAYRCEVARYVHLNPTRALRDMAPEDYPWSDYGSTIGLYPPDPLVNARIALAPFGSNLAQARASYRAYVEERDVRVRRGQTRVRPRSSG
jgi:REP element-mobilizing transposase RayT